MYAQLSKQNYRCTSTNTDIRCVAEQIYLQQLLMPAIECIDGLYYLYILVHLFIIANNLHKRIMLKAAEYIRNAFRFFQLCCTACPLYLYTKETIFKRKKHAAQHRNANETKTFTKLFIRHPKRAKRILNKTRNSKRDNIIHLSTVSGAANAIQGVLQSGIYEFVHVDSYIFIFSGIERTIRQSIIQGWAVQQQRNQTVLREHEQIARYKSS